MILRTGVALALLAMCSSGTSPLRARELWVDETQVLPVGRVRLSMGIGAVLFSHPHLADLAHPQVGTGLNLEQTVGLARSVEMGVRFGLRLNDVGRGLRADESARVFDTETFGTGLSVSANPELRLRWRLIRWSWGETGVENRFVLPIEPDPDFTEVLGLWTSLNLAHVARLDVGFNSVIVWQSFAQSRTVTPAFGMPVAFWVNVSDALFAGLLTSLRHVGSTSYTDSATRYTVGAGLGYRFGNCDLIQATHLLDVLGAYVDRVGVGLALACRL